MERAEERGSGRSYHRWMKLVRRLGWLLVLLLAWFAAFVVTGMALSEGAGLSFGWLAAVWGVFDGFSSLPAGVRSRRMR